MTKDILEKQAATASCSTDHHTVDALDGISQESSPPSEREGTSEQEAIAALRNERAGLADLDCVEQKRADLQQKRAELQQRLAEKRACIALIDAVIQLFDPAAYPEQIL